MKKIFLIILLFFAFANLVFAEDVPLKRNKEVARSEVKDHFRLPERKLFYNDNKYFIIDEYEYVEEIGEREILHTGEMNSYLYDNNWNKQNELVGITSRDVRLSSVFYIDDYYYSISQNAYYYFSDKSVFEISRVGKNFDRDVMKLEYNRKNYTLNINELYFENNEYIYFLVNEFYYAYVEGKNIRINEFRILRIDKDLSDYTFFDLDDEEIINNAPDYFNQIIIPNIASGLIDGESNYFLENDRLLISGDTLSYYDNLEKKFEISSEDYVRFGQAKVYNELIIAIGYKNYPRGYEGDSDSQTTGLNNSDILLFDLEGNLLSKYEHNAYDFDFSLIDNQLIVANLYVDGICKGEYRSGDLGGYFSYNSTCRGTLQNEIFDLDAKFLGMAVSEDKVVDDIIENPETLPDINVIIIFSFIFSIIITFSLLVKSKIKRI